MHRPTLVLGKQLLPLRRRALLFRALVPRRYWFLGVLALSRVHAAIARMAGRRHCARYESSCVDRWLIELTLSGPFPIEYRVEGAEHLVKTAADEAGILCCSVHLPLATVMMRGFVELGAAPDYVIAAAHNINPDGRCLAAGTREGFKAIAPGSGTLRQARIVLTEGGRFASMLDEDVGAPLRPALMRLAGSVRARVVLCWAEMDAAQRIIVSYRTPPYPVPDTEEKVWANLAVLDELRARVLAGLQGQYWGRDQELDPARPLPPSSSPGSEESDSRLALGL